MPRRDKHCLWSSLARVELSVFLGLERIRESSLQDACAALGTEPPGHLSKPMQRHSQLCGHRPVTLQNLCFWPCYYVVYLHLGKLNGWPSPKSLAIACVVHKARWNDAKLSASGSGWFSRVLTQGTDEHSLLHVVLCKPDTNCECCDCEMLSCQCVALKWNCRCHGAWNLQRHATVREVRVEMHEVLCHKLSHLIKS